MAFGDPQQGLPGLYLSRHIPAAYSKRSTPTEKPEARQKRIMAANEICSVAPCKYRDFG